MVFQLQMALKIFLTLTQIAPILTPKTNLTFS